jgi:hypothetical protein
LLALLDEDRFARILLVGFGLVRLVEACFPGVHGRHRVSGGKHPHVARDVGLGGRAFAVSPPLPPVAAARVVLLRGRRELRLGLRLRFGHRPRLRRLRDAIIWT